MIRIPLLRNKFPDETLVARTPPYRQPPPELLLYAVHLFVKLTSRHPINRTCRHRIHGREFEQTYRFFNVVILYDRREGYLSQ